MINQNDDTGQALRRLLLMFSFLLLALVASTGRGNDQPGFAGKSWTTTDISCHEAIAGITVSYVAAQKSYETDFHNNIFVPLSYRNQISDYNRKLSRDFFLNRITGFSVKPACREIYLNLPYNKDDIPVLS